jgi:hypothetical protein
MGRSSSKGSFQVSTSYITTPKLYTSLALVSRAGWLLNTWGQQQQGKGFCAWFS